MSESLTGTCLCGSVEYEVQDPESGVLPLHAVPEVDGLEPRGGGRSPGELQVHQGRGSGLDV